mmetsp:Transcript_28052/g.79282  ORF Transcript_28052/g.79282 Transcript_28052/m.79282 type:complete len:393 (-) Transcript_28052:262-1440(-)
MSDAGNGCASLKEGDVAAGNGAAAAPSLAEPAGKEPCVETSPVPAEAPARVPATESPAKAAADDADGTPLSQDKEQDSEAITAEVLRLKATLDSKESPPAALTEALKALGELGSLSTKVLGDTLIGKTVNQIAKAFPDEAVRASARELVEGWRQKHRKRKSEMGSAPAVKRSMSLLSEFSEAPTLSASLDRAASMISLADSSVDFAAEDNATNPQRDKVRQKLVEALGKEEEIETKGEEEGKKALDDKMRDPVILGTDIERALHEALGQKRDMYLNQSRSILYNLKDSKNPTFRFKLMVGFYKPEDMPKLTAEDMASDAKNAERAKQRQYAMEEIQSDWALKHGAMRISGMFTCGKCKGTRTTYFQMQTRSSDEPMTTFVTCLTCSNRWKFC